MAAGGGAANASPAGKHTRRGGGVLPRAKGNGGLDGRLPGIPYLTVGRKEKQMVLSYILPR